MTDARLSEGGFSFVEILVVVAIMLALAAVAVVSLSALRERTLLREAAGSLVFHLEESKARAVAGVGGQPHGVHFAADRYVQFQGAAYDPADPANVAHALDGRLALTADILNNIDTIVFSRITGRIDDVAVVTVSLQSDAEKKSSVTIGPGGDVSRDE